jgi:hypothetical protein
MPMWQKPSLKKWASDEKKEVWKHLRRREMDFYLAEADNYDKPYIPETPADMIAPRNIFLAGNYGQVKGLLTKNTAQLKNLFRNILQVS